MTSRSSGWASSRPAGVSKGRPGGALNGPVKLQRFRDQAAWQHERAVIRVGREPPAS